MSIGYLRVGSIHIQDKKRKAISATFLTFVHYKLGQLRKLFKERLEKFHTTE